MQESTLTELLEIIKIKLAERECASYESLELTPGEYRLMAATIGIENLSCGVLREKIGISPSRFSRTIDRLENKGLIIRKIDSEDRRNIVLSFTERGKDLLDRIRAMREHCESEIVSGLSRTQEEKIKQAMVLLIKQM